jgi:hypothetical protein
MLDPSPPPGEMHIVFQREKADRKIVNIYGTVAYASSSPDLLFAL